MLTLFVVLAVAALLFVAAVVATQDRDVLVEAPPDGPDVELPAGQVVAEDLRAVRFAMVFRGYRMSEVDEVLERLAAELTERDERIADLERVLAELVEPVVAQAEAQQELTVEPEPQPAAGEAEWLAATGVAGAEVAREVADEAAQADPAAHESSPADRAPDLAASFWPASGVGEVIVPTTASQDPAEPLEPFGSEVLSEPVPAAPPSDPHPEPEPEPEPEPAPEPEPEPEPEAWTPPSQSESESEPGQERVQEQEPWTSAGPPADVDGFPEVAPAEPAVPGVPEAVDDTGDAAREQPR